LSDVRWVGSLGFVLCLLPSICEAGIIDAAELSGADGFYSVGDRYESNIGGMSSASASTSSTDDSRRPDPSGHNSYEHRQSPRLDGLLGSNGGCSAPTGGNAGSAGGLSIAVTDSQVVLPQLSCSGRVVVAAPLPLLPPLPWEMLDPPKCA
jgi:hypothetical protein